MTADVTLQPYPLQECSCMAVAFEYITGVSRNDVINHPKYKIEHGGLNWKLFVQIAADLGYETKILYTLEATDDSDEEEEFGELVESEVLMKQISEHPAIVAERNQHNDMGREFTTEHALAYVGDLQLDPAFGSHHPNSRRKIIGAILFSSLAADESMGHIERMSAEHKEKHRGE